MGYHVSITRERNGSESDIPLDDWLAHVRASSDLQFETPKGTDSASEFTRSIHAARWSGAEDAWLGWSRGEIWTKNPPTALIGYMIGIAPAFNARVRGDEGEFYRTLEDAYFEKEGREVPWREHEQRRASHIKRRQLIRNCILIGLLLLALCRFIQKHFL